MINYQPLVNLIKNKGISIHIDMIGLYKLGKSNEERIKVFKKFLENLKNNDIDVFIPTYSYSYTKKEIFDIKNSKSDVGLVTDELRKIDYKKRSIDPLFSYLIYSKKDFLNHKIPKDYTSFGKNSLIEYMYKNDFYLGVIGTEIRMLTEIHYLEYLNKEKFNLDYRYEKDFFGKTMGLNGKIKDTKVTFFCRNIEKYPNLLSNFIDMQEDIKKSGLVKTINLSNKLLIHLISFKDLESFLLKQWKKNRFYTTIDKDERFKKETSS